MLLADSIIPFVDLMAVIDRSHKCGNCITALSTAFTDGPKQEPLFVLFPETILTDIQKRVISKKTRDSFDFGWLRSCISVNNIDASLLTCMERVATTTVHRQLLCDLNLEFLF
jgi:hypothetical protein